MSAKRKKSKIEQLTDDYTQKLERPDEFETHSEYNILRPLETDLIQFQ